MKPARMNPRVCRDSDKFECARCKRKYWLFKMAFPGVCEKCAFWAEQREIKTGWTYEAFEHAFELQGGACAICACPMKRTGTTFNSASADHCHRWHKPREILCASCNRGIGFLKDNPYICEAAAAYIRKHAARFEDEAHTLHDYELESE